MVTKFELSIHLSVLIFYAFEVSIDNNTVTLMNYTNTTLQRLYTNYWPDRLVHVSDVLTTIVFCRYLFNVYPGFGFITFNIRYLHIIS